MRGYTISIIMEGKGQYWLNLCTAFSLLTAIKGRIWDSRFTNFEYIDIFIRLPRFYNILLFTGKIFFLFSDEIESNIHYMNETSII